MTLDPPSGDAHLDRVTPEDPHSDADRAAVPPDLARPPVVRRPRRRPVAPRLDDGGRRLLVLLIALCTAIEALVVAGDAAGLRLRAAAIEWGGFWPGLLSDWRPLYRGQPAAMFVTYGFLHGGLLHLGINMLTLWSLGRAVLIRAGTFGFVLVYAAGLLGGGLGYGLLATGDLPMVGASGALFGLAGAFLAWHLADRVALSETVVPVLKAAAFLAAINVAMAVALAGNLAWEAHLGGFLAGAAMAFALGRHRP